MVVVVVVVVVVDSALPLGAAVSQTMFCLGSHLASTINHKEDGRRIYSQQ